MDLLWESGRSWLTAWLLINFVVDTSNGSVPSAAESDNATAQLPAGPEFVVEFSGNLTATVGGSVILNCRVKHIGDTKQVSWGHGVRLLTAGMEVFVDDPRYQTLHQAYSDDWGLRITSVRWSDAGVYFCQVSSTPPVSHEVVLDVVEPSVEIVGGPDLHIYKGSNANLTCLIQGAYQKPKHVRWTHNSKLVQFDPARRGVRVRTLHESGRTVSFFSIERALPSDSGEYFCDPDGLRQAKVIVHVLSADDPAAMQTTGHAHRSYHSDMVVTSLSLLLALVLTVSC